MNSTEVYQLIKPINILTQAKNISPKRYLQVQHEYQNMYWIEKF